MGKTGALGVEEDGELRGLGWWGSGEGEGKAAGDGGT